MRSHSVTVGTFNTIRTTVLCKRKPSLLFTEHSTGKKRKLIFSIIKLGFVSLTIWPWSSRPQISIIIFIPLIAFVVSTAGITQHRIIFRSIVAQTEIIEVARFLRMIAIRIAIGAPMRLPFIAVMIYGVRNVRSLWLFSTWRWWCCWWQSILPIAV